MVTELEIRVGLKEGVADPEGGNVEKALELLGFSQIEGVKSAKCYRITMDCDLDIAEKEAEKMCQRLLANPVVHDYSITVIN